MNQNNQHPVFQNAEMKAYFDTLPAVVQESVMQSGVSVNTLEQLKDCAEKFLERK